MTFRQRKKGANRRLAYWVMVPVTALWIYAKARGHA